jgi:hypothetical protein
MDLCLYLLKKKAKERVAGHKLLFFVLIKGGPFIFYL